jgi:glycosyltransferase involved in cell wall biosynthesis
MARLRKCAPETTLPLADTLLVVPTRGDRPELLQQTLRSITAAGDARIVVIATRISEVSDICSRQGVELVRQSSAGQSAAVNEVWRAATTADYFAWLGDDDLLTPGSLARAHETLEGTPNATFVYGDCGWINADGDLLWVLRPNRYARLTLGFGPNLLPQPGSLLRADAVREVGMLDESLQYAMDLDLFLRLLRLGPACYLPRLQAHFRMHAGSATTSDVSASWEEARLVQLRHTPLSPVVWRAAARGAWLLYPLASRLLTTKPRQ